jgi:hypothetical protein
VQLLLHWNAAALNFYSTRDTNEAGKGRAEPPIKILCRVWSVLFCGGDLACRVCGWSGGCFYLLF